MKIIITRFDFSAIVNYLRITLALYTVVNQFSVTGFIM